MIITYSYKNPTLSAISMLMEITAQLLSASIDSPTLLSNAGLHISKSNKSHNQTPVNTAYKYKPVFFVRMDKHLQFKRKKISQQM